jgi:amidase
MLSHFNRVLVCWIFLLFPSHVGAEQWIVRTDFWGVPAYYTLTLERKGESVSGDLDGQSISGTGTEQGVVFRYLEEQGGNAEYSGVIDGSRMIGTATYTDRNNADRRNQHAFLAWRVPGRDTDVPQLHVYEPVDFSATFDPDRHPVLVVWPNDTISTKTIDSGGVDENGVTKALFGNPQTGPFFIVGAEAGDTLVVHLRQVETNRDYADSLDEIVRRARGRSFDQEAVNLGQPIRWIIDRQKGVVRPQGAEGKLADFAVPLRPMLGGMAVAPGFGFPALNTGDTGRFGGNMDFPEVVAGNTVYLVVQRPGALLYMGDGHAAQGQGETSQYGLETSLSVTFTVDLIKGEGVSAPRVDSPDEIMTLGQSGTMEDALINATSAMTDLLRREYGFTLSQTAQVMGSALEIDVVNLAGRNVGIAAKINRNLLPDPLGILTRKPD